MAAPRSSELQSFLNLAVDAIRNDPRANEQARLAAERVFLLLQNPALSGDQRPPARLPACDHLPTALDNARCESKVAALVDAFAAIEPHLNWKRRDGAASHGEQFLNG